jgi:hypothetical protein
LAGFGGNNANEVPTESPGVVVQYTTPGRGIENFVYDDNFFEIAI